MKTIRKKISHCLWFFSAGKSFFIHSAHLWFPVGWNISVIELLYYVCFFLPSFLTESAIFMRPTWRVVKKLSIKSYKNLLAVIKNHVKEMSYVVWSDSDILYLMIKFWKVFYLCIKTWPQFLLSFLYITGEKAAVVQLTIQT